MKTTICDAIRQTGKLVVIDHVDADETFREHPTPRAYGFQSYISVPVTLPESGFFGTLCAIDPRPARVSAEHTVGMFQLFAELICMHLHARLHLRDKENTLVAERQTSDLRDQFIAVLGHDLRSPLASIDAGARLLRKTPLDPRGEELVSHIESSVQRMSGLIHDVLDFARGQLGDGIPVAMGNGAGLADALGQVLSEVRLASPAARIDATISITHSVSCDVARLAQMFSNLLANAVSHGDLTRPIRAEVVTGRETLEMKVENGGAPIPADMLPLLFQPFVRAAANTGQQGLGLGLYIASQIAKGHRGTIEVTSDEDRTCFSFRMPIG